MATYDNEQQEQLDQFKHFWKQYGNLITWVLVLVLGAYAAWTGYQYWQQKRGLAAAGLYEEMDRAVSGGQSDKAAQAFADLVGYIDVEALEGIVLAKERLRWPVGGGGHVHDLALVDAVKGGTGPGGAGGGGGNSATKAR